MDVPAIMAAIGIACWGSVKTGSDEAFCGRHSPQGRLPRNDHPTALITSSQHQLLLPLLPPLPPPSPPPRSPRISSHTKVIEKENPSTRSTTVAIASEKRSHTETTTDVSDESARVTERRLGRRGPLSYEEQKRSSESSWQAHGGCGRRGRREGEFCIFFTVLA